MGGHSIKYPSCTKPRPLGAITSTDHRVEEKMKKLIQIYNALSIIEIVLLCNVLLHIAFIIAKRPSQYFDLIFVFILFLIPIVISWKVLLLTNKSSKVSETLVIIGHIFNIIKILVLLLLILGGLYFFMGTSDFITIENEKGVWYYLFFFSFFLFIIVSLLTFISYYAISRDNGNRINNIIKTIGNLKD